ncbi:Predicted Zn-dependent peptidase [Pedobacter steynii]|uniref:Predicted Zn-dependent peptidase n=1 Tax=Pedobacter steynii TaxID=430522 RepID=A0A1G9PEY9_9SPHI|nr:pitrilysin family protein [Pedobacter steynii]NQX39009.1 insulinase family protein [Pedobacter steynii]SDL97123.1 Predicted Zn-dependent peptidase [Pedobacter steynii]
MKYNFLIALSLSALCLRSTAQQVKFSEYDLDNGLHVILHQDKTAPVVAVSVMYHVGSKDEDPGRTGFAHFFEHLLFEGSENMKRGEFMKIVSSNGGQNNANTTQDRTFYYEVFPSNQLELGLWLESERMLHPKIDNAGVKTQNEVIKEEKRMRIDNKPYGKFAENIFAHLFEGHPYSWQPIGSMAHLDAARLEEFIAFFKKYYAPNNAVLTIAGDLDIEKTKGLVAKYFNEVPKGIPIVKGTFELKPVTKQIVDTVYDANIQIPAIFAAYRVPGMKSRDHKVLEMISSVLSGGGSSRLSTKMVDEKKTALQVSAFNYTLEDYGAYITLAMPNNNTPLDQLLTEIDAEVVRLQTDLITESEFKKLQNQFENGYVSANTKMIGLAENLSNGYIFHDKHTNNLNEQLAEAKSISREEIRDVAKKYLRKDQRVVLYYLPKK